MLCMKLKQLKQKIQFRYNSVFTSHRSISQASKKYMMKLFFFILFLGISISLARPPNSPYEGMVPLFI